MQLSFFSGWQQMCTLLGQVGGGARFGEAAGTQERCSSMQLGRCSFQKDRAALYFVDGFADDAVPSS